MYACGLRISEAATLDIGAIDNVNLLLRIVGKGSKQRLVPLPPAVLDALRSLWRTHRHPRWVFPNRDCTGSLSQQVLGCSFRVAARLAEITLPVTPHSLCHSWIGSDPPAVVYSCATGRGQQHNDRVPGGCRGILQCHGYATYKKLAHPKRGEEAVTLVFCWSHVRRACPGTRPPQTSLTVKPLPSRPQSSAYAPPTGRGFQAQSFAASAPGPSTGGLGQKIPLYNELTDLRVQLLHLSLGRPNDIMCRFLAGEHRRQVLHGLLPPLTHRRLVHTVLGRQLRRRQLAPQRLKRHARLELSPIPLPLARHRVRPSRQGNQA